MAVGRRIVTLVAGLSGLALLGACAEDDPEPLADRGGQLIPIETPPPVPTSDPSAATTLPPSTTTTVAPVDPMTGCLDWYRFKIESGDSSVVAFWQEQLGEDLVQLVAECERLVAEEPQRIDDMIEENRRIEEFLRVLATATTVPA
jgi:hypothetical protein